MNPLIGTALFFILWWLCFFLVLPIGVRNIGEAGVGETRGHDAGAPEKPNLGRKALWATAGAALVWAVVVLVLNAVYYSR
jgi:predicted secreted protein